MQLRWQIRRSHQCLGLIYFLALIPIGLSVGSSLLLDMTNWRFILIMILTPLFIYLLTTNLYSSILPNSASQTNELYWLNPRWLYTDGKKFIDGLSSKSSFVLGPLIFLSIEDRKGHRVNLWLFKDSLVGGEQEWRQLHASYQLSYKLKAE